MPLFNSLREKRFKNMTTERRKAYQAEREQLVTISLSRSSGASSKK